MTALDHSLVVFPTASLDRRDVCWEDKLRVETPVETHDLHSYKREDAFAPLGAGGINGTKLRQLIWLVSGKAHARGVLTAASVLSPQLPMTALVARHFGLPCHIIIGGTTVEKAMRHEGVLIAAAAGATIEAIKVGYNPALQAALKERLASPAYAGWTSVPYGISCPPDVCDGAVADFHLVSAPQVRNLPPDLHTLIVPFGSGNSAASILLGLSLWRPPSLDRVILFGIGPNRLDWLDARLATFERALGEPVRSHYRRLYPSRPQMADLQNLAASPRPDAIRLDHVDLHESGFASYSDKMPGSLDGIALHPTYEGKIARFLAQHPDQYVWWHSPTRRVGLWIVGSLPRIDRMAHVLNTL